MNDQQISTFSLEKVSFSISKNMSIQNIGMNVLRIAVVLLLFNGKQDVIANEKKGASNSIEGKKRKINLSGSNISKYFCLFIGLKILFGI